MWIATKSQRSRQRYVRSKPTLSYLNQRKATRSQQHPTAAHNPCIMAVFVSMSETPARTEKEDLRASTACRVTNKAPIAQSQKALTAPFSIRASVLQHRRLQRVQSALGDDAREEKDGGLGERGQCVGRGLELGDLPSAQFR